MDDVVVGGVVHRRACGRIGSSRHKGHLSGVETVAFLDQVELGPRDSDHEVSAGEREPLD